MPYAPANYPPSLKRGVKKLDKNKLYVLKKNVRNSITGEWHKEFWIVSPKKFQSMSSFPKVELQGELLHNTCDLFIVLVNGLFALDREEPVSASHIEHEMMKTGIYEAIYIGKDDKCPMYG